MNGEVDSSGRALLTLRVRTRSESPATEWTVWIDTAFTGQLVVPLRTIDQIGLRKSAAITAGLADGSSVVLETYSCLLDWFGEPQMAEVIASDGECPLLGVELLLGHRLEVDYRSRTVVVE